MNKKPNEIISYLNGKWLCKNIVIKPEVKPEVFSYEEIMKIKNENTITITAFKINNGEDVTKDIQIDLNKQKLRLSQGDFHVEGMYKANHAELKNDNYQGNKYLIRLSFLEDNYIYQMEVYDNEKLIMSQISYLERLTK